MTQQAFATLTRSTQSTPTQSTQTQESRRQQTVARLLGAQSFASIHWQRLLQDGTMVELHVGHCGFTTRLQLSDLGIQIEDPQVRDKLARWTTLGDKRLLPEAEFKAVNQLVGAARYLLRQHAFRTELGYFVPLTAYEAWRSQTERLRAQYLALRDDLIATHRDLVREVLSEYEVIAADTYRRLRATHPDLVHENEQQFVANYCNRIASQIPSPERIRDSFTFRFFRVASTQQLGIFRQESQEEVVAQERATETEERAQARAILEHDVRQDAQQRMQAQLDQFLAALVAQLRVLFYDVATDVLATLQRRGGEQFSPRSTVQLNNLLAEVQRLKFFPDSELDQMLARIQEIVNQSPAERRRSITDIERTLRAIATTARATLLDLDVETRAPAANLGIAAFPSEHLVNAARAELRLPAFDLSQVTALSPDVRTVRAELSGPAEGLWNFVERQARTEARVAQVL